MPPLAYARIPKTPRRELVALPKKRTFNLATLLPPRRNAPSYVREVTKTPHRKSRNWPATIMIERSTRIYGQMPTDDYEISNNLLYDDDSPRSGYFVEKSEVEISAPMNQVFREKRYSIKAFFDTLSRRGRFRRETNDKEVADSDQAENASKLLAILARNHRTTDKTRRDTVSHSRSKRQVPEVANPQKPITRKRKSGYTPVFKDCKDTAASEISDLNAPPPSAQRRLTLEPYSLNGDIDISRRRNRPPVDRREKQLSGLDIATTVAPSTHREEEEVVESPKETASSAKSTNNATYINLQDHQKGTQDGNPAKDANGYPLDIPPYNPDVIPYVDVPDYSDQREESLDKDDRRVAKEKFVEYPDEDADAVDPGVPVSDKKAEKIIVNDDEVAERDQRPEVKGDEEVKEEEEAEEQNEEVEDEPTPRVSSDDHEDVEENKGNEETASEDVGDSKSDNGMEFLPLQFDINDYIKPFNLDELFKEIKRDAQKLERMKKSKEDVAEATEQQGSKKIPVREIKQVVIPSFTLPFLAPVKKEALIPERLQEEDKKEALGSERVEEKEKNEALGSERVEEEEKKEALSSERVEEEDKKEDIEEELLPPANFYEEFDKIFGPSATKKSFSEYFGESDDDKERPSGMSTIADHEKYPYGDENTYERLFGIKDDEDESEPVKAVEEDDEEDSKLHSEDDDESAGYTDEKKSEDVEEAEEPTGESLQKAYRTLAGILDRKDDVSRLDDEVAIAAKKEGKMPAMYNNYWTLEYGTPTKAPEKT